MNRKIQYFKLCVTFCGLNTYSAECVRLLAIIHSSECFILIRFSTSFSKQRDVATTKELISSTCKIRWLTQ